jgi:hypothetical protein
MGKSCRDILPTAFSSRPVSQSSFNNYPNWVNSGDTTPISPVACPRLPNYVLCPPNGPTAIAQLPETADVDTMMYRLYVIDKVMKGRNAVEKGETISAEDLKREIESWSIRGTQHLFPRWPVPGCPIMCYVPRMA